MTGGTLMPGHAPLADHPLARIFPLLKDHELAELADDIAQNGQVETVKLHRGMILDGRNRYRACGLKNIAVRTEIFTGDEKAALNFVISKNLKRRHLDETDRARVAARLADFGRGDNQHTRQLAQICAPSLPGVEAAPEAPLVTQSEAADLLNVSRRSVQTAKFVEERATPELNDALDQRKVSISTAAVIAQASPEEQKKIAALSEKEILEAAKKIRKEQNEKRRADRTGRILQLANASGALPTGRKFPVIYFDPPTKFAAGDSDRSTENHYPTMTEEELAALPIDALATPDAVLFVWTTVPWLRKTIRLCEEKWGGFEYVSEYAWDKVKISTGFWNRNRHECLLIFTRGKMPAPARELLEDSVHAEARGEHSAKPAFFRDMIGRYYPDLPKVELFARVDGPMPEGWHAWGNEARVPQQQSLATEAAE